MTLPATLIKTALQTSVGCMADRVDLNLPNAQTTFPFRGQQQDALNLAISNSPIAAIAGIPGSGKTRVALAALATAINHQKSTLVVAGKSRSLEAYNDLPLPPLTITEDTDYRDSVYGWVKQQLANPLLTFCPSHWLPDPLFEQLTVTPHRCQWLQRLQSAQSEEIATVVAQELPDVHPARQQLLVRRLQQAHPLLAQREQLWQNYTHLSAQALQDITDGLLATMTIPVLCVSQQLETLGQRVFDWVVVEDTHTLAPENLLNIARRAKKLVLLGEVEDRQSSFTRIFYRLWPSDRVVLTENHRLHPDLAYPIFSSFYPSSSVPYTPPTRPYTPLPERLSRLAWYDVVANEQLIPSLWTAIQAFPNCHHSVLTFSPDSARQLRQQQRQVRSNNAIGQQIDIQAIDHWHGEAHAILWVVCDSTADAKPSLTDVRWALTRATEAIGVIGNKTHYERSVFAPLFRSSLTFIRNIDL